MNRNCNCHPPKVRITRGNDFTVEARTSVYDTAKGIYVPFDISAAEDISVSIVGLYSRISGGDVKVTPEGVSASFPGSVPVGPYGVEILFRDSEGEGRIFERNLFEVVATSGEATLESSSEGETGDGYNISVDVRTRTVRVGKSTGVTDYTLLDNKPSINGHVLDGDKTAEDFGVYSKDRINELLASKREVYKLSVEEAKALLLESNYPMESMPDILKPLLTKLKEKIWLTLEVPVDVIGISGSEPVFSFISLDAYCQTVDIKSDDGETKGALFVITGYYPGEDPVIYQLAQVESPQVYFLGTFEKQHRTVDWDVTDKNSSSYIANKPETQRLLIKVFESSGRISMYPQDIYEAVHKLKVPIFIGEVGDSVNDYCFSYPVIYSYARKNSNGTYGIDLIWLSTDQNKIIIKELSFINGKSLYYDSLTSIGINPYKLSELPDFIKSGDGRKFLNDKGEYVDPVAGVKSSVEALAPYDCTWAWRLKQGDEAPADKVDELCEAIEKGRTLFTKYTDKNGYVLSSGIKAEYWWKDDTIITLYSVYKGSLSWLIIDDYTSADYDYSVSAKKSMDLQEKLVSGTNLKTVNGQSLLGDGDIVTDKAVISPLPDVFGGTSAEFFANLKELYDAGTLKLNNIYYGNTELTDLVDGLLVQEMRVEVLPGDGGQVVFSAVATTSTYDNGLKPFRWETQSLNGGFTKWVGRATQDSIPTKVSELANDAGYAKADTLETITDATEITVTCESGRTYQGNNIMTLAVGCTASDNSTAAEERIVFSTGSSVESVTVTGASWANGDTPSFKANKVYEISITYVPILGKFLAAYAEY